MKPLSHIKAALLVDGDSIPLWMHKAVSMATRAGVDIPLVLVCRTPRQTKLRLGHLLYYVLNLLVMRRGGEEKMTKVSELDLNSAELFEFEAVKSTRKGWDALPPSVEEKVRSLGCHLVIKAGMGLVENPDACGAPMGMLSYHHGDPARFRGRPAGFWELLSGERKVGFIVQRLCDKLDAGTVLAYGETTAVAHSYRKTLHNVRSLSSFLLVKAIRAASRGEHLRVPTNGKNFRLPSNLQVLRFVLLLGAAKLRRVVYGLFVQKEWKVGVSGPFEIHSPSLDIIPPPPLKVGPNHLFYADPFWSRDGNILVEAMRKDDGLAEILEIAQGGTTLISDKDDAHWSYPSVLVHQGAEYVIAEVATWSPPFAIRKGGTERVYLAGLSHERIADPTLLRHGASWFLFGTTPPFENSALRLWMSSDSPFGPYVEHPLSPVLIKDAGARMAGPILSRDGRLYRFGQDFTEGYGSAVMVHEIEQVDRSDYHERLVGRVRFFSAKGPHTMSFGPEGVLLDWYHERPSPLAWLRRTKMSLSSIAAKNRREAKTPSPPRDTVT